MRKAALIMSFVVVAGLSCAGTKQTQTPTTTVKWPKEALEPLTQEDVTQLVKALPALNGALKAAKWKNPNAVARGDTAKDAEIRRDQLGTLSKLVESYKLPGMEDSLRPYGGWVRIRSTLYKVYAATAALGMDRTPPELIANLQSDTTIRGRNTLTSIEFFKNACVQIPEANKQLVLKNVDDLQPLGALGH